MKYVRSNLRFSFTLLIFLSLLSGLLLVIYSFISKMRCELLSGLVTLFLGVKISWLGVERLILRRVNWLIGLSKRLAARDLSVRSGETHPVGLMGKHTQTTDQMVAFLERKDRQIRMHANQVATLSELASDIAIEKDISIVIDHVLEKIMTFLNTTQATMALYNPAMDNLVVTAAKGVPIPVGMRIKMGEGPIGRAAQTRQPVVVDDYAHREGPLPESGELSNSVVVQLPMVSRGDLVGVLGVAAITLTHQFNQEEILLLNQFAEHAASAIKNFYLFEDSRRCLQIMEAINEITTSLRITENIDDLLSMLLEKTTSIVNATIGSIWLYNMADNTLHEIVSNGIPQGEIRLHPTEGIIGKVFSSGEPEYLSGWIGDRRKDASIHSQVPPETYGAFFPIRSTHAVVGVLGLGFHSPIELSADRMQLMTNIMEMVGNAIYRMQLQEQTKSQLQRLRSLRTIDLAITSSLDLGNTLHVLLEQVTTQVGVDAACVLVFNPHEQTLEFAASLGFITDALRNTRLRLGEGYAGRAVLEQQTVYIADLKTRRTDFLRSPAFIAEGFVTYIAIPLISKSQAKGVLEIFQRSPIEHEPEWLDFLESLSSQAAIAIDNAALFNDLQRSNTELNLAYISTIEGWARALDLRDKVTEGHSRRVTELTIRLARAVSVGEADLIHIRHGALLHDIGKLGIPDSILLKTGPLSEDEMGIIKKHPTIAFELLVPIPYLQQALDIPYCHHEKWDGSGYPRGLKGKEIPLSARIFAIVDVWDALTSDRPYRKKWTQEEARDYIQEQAGKHFDPHIVDIFFAILDG